LPGLDRPRAARRGQAGDAVYLANASESVSVRLGALEDVERSEAEHIGLRVFVGGASASIGSTDMGDAALDELAARAVAMARAAPVDRFAGLADAALLAHAPFPDLDLDDPAEPRPQDLRRLAQEAEDAARAVPGVTNSEGAGAGAGRGSWRWPPAMAFPGPMPPPATAFRQA
jgi:PmbA protein